LPFGSQFLISTFLLSTGRIVLKKIRLTYW
jgi:hypothetical protein